MFVLAATSLVRADDGNLTLRKAGAAGEAERDVLGVWAIYSYKEYSIL